MNPNKNCSDPKMHPLVKINVASATQLICWKKFKFSYLLVDSAAKWRISSLANQKMYEGLSTRSVLTHQVLSTSGFVMKKTGLKFQ